MLKNFTNVLHFCFHFSNAFVFFSQLCESLEELQNMNAKLRNEGQGIWAVLGRIIGQVGFSHSFSPPFISCWSYDS